MSKTKVTTLTEPNNYRYTIYTIPRKFRDGAKLQPLLANKTPDMINMKTNEYTLLTVSIRSMLPTLTNFFVKWSILINFDFENNSKFEVV